MGTLEFGLDGLPVGFGLDADSAEECRPFNPWRVAREASLQDYIADVADLCASSLERRPASLPKRVQAIVCDLVHAKGSGTQRLTIERTRKSTGLNLPGFMKPAGRNSALDALQRLGVLAQENGRQGQPTLLTLGAHLEEAIAEHGWGKAAVASAEDRPSIIVLGRPRRKGKAGRQTFSEVRYERTQEVDELKKEMDELNYLLAVEIEFRVGGTANYKCDLTDTHLTRVFYAGNPTWQTPWVKLAGTLYGGFWQKMNPAERGRIRIDGQAPYYVQPFGSPLVSLLDCAEVQALRNPTIRRAVERETPEKKLTAKALNWQGVAAVEQALLFAPKPLFAKIPPQLHEHFPEGTRLKHVLDELKEGGSRTLNFLETEVGWRLMSIQSRVIVEAALRCLDEGTLALPLANGLITSRGDAGLAAIILEGVYEEHTGAKPVVWPQAVPRPIGRSPRAALSRSRPGI